MKPWLPSELEDLAARIGPPRYRITQPRPTSYVDGLKRYYARAYIEHLLTKSRDVSEAGNVRREGRNVVKLCRSSR